MNDVIISKRNGGLGRKNPTEDMVTAMIGHGVAVAGKFALGASIQLYSISDAKALGIDAAYDTTNSVQVFYHIDEFFRINPNGELWVMLLAQATAFDAMLDTANANARKLLADAEGRVRQLGVFFNPAAGYTSTLTDGLDGQVFTAVTKAQLLCVYQDEINAPLDAVVIDGREYNGTAAAAKDLRTLASEKVSVCIHRDHKILTGLKASGVGTLMGTISKAKVNENIGWVQKFNVASTLLGKYLQAGLTNGSAISSLNNTDLNTLNTKGYIFLRKIADAPGLYFNDSHTCTVISSDYAYIENNRTLDKAIRGIRKKLVPKVSGPLEVDEETGRLAPETAKSYESDADDVIGEMKSAKEVSGGYSYCDEKQDVLSTSRVDIQINVVPYGTGRTIGASIGFSNPFKQ